MGYVFVSSFSLAALAFANLVAHAEPIQGSGSTFAAPFVSDVSKEYLRFLNDGGDFVSNDNAVSYEPVGSLGGILRLSDAGVDFAAADFSLSPAELKQRGWIQFPIVAGAIVPVVNLSALKDKPVRFPGSVLADIYLGKVQKWNDPALVAANPGVTMPDQRIEVVHRSDGSGSTLAFTEYLSAKSPDWKAGYGAQMMIAWPLGTSVEGGSRMAAAVKGKDGAIGYLELGQARRAGLTVASIENAGGGFALPEAATMQAAIAAAKIEPAQDFHASIIRSATAQSYPMTVVTYIMMRENAGFFGNERRASRFFRHLLVNGASTAERLGYLPLPPELRDAASAYLAQRFGGGS